MVTIGNAMGATIPVAFGQIRCNVLIDTGAMKSCMSQTFYQQLMLPTMRNVYPYQVKSATGSNLCPMGITGCEFKIGDKGCRTDFVVCKNLTRPCILGIDFLRKHNIFAGWTAEGKFKLISQQEFLVESLEVLMDGPMIYVMQLRSGEDPRLQDTLKNASYWGGRAANDLIIPQPKVMAVHGLYGPAPAKQINS